MTISKIDLKQLAEEIKNMTRHDALYICLRDNLRLLGFWRAKPRGNPRKGYDEMLRHKNGK